MKCASCKFDNPEGMNFCGKCGSPLTMACPSCGYHNPAGFKACKQCKEKIVHNNDVVPGYAKRSALEYTPPFLLERTLKYKRAMVGERKLVSVLFADVANFTGIAEKLDPEDVHEIMDHCFGILGRDSLQKALVLSLEMGTYLLTQKVRYACKGAGTFELDSEKALNRRSK